MKHRQHSRPARVLVCAAAAVILASAGAATDAPHAGPARCENQDASAPVVEAEPPLSPELRRILDQLDKANEKLKDVTAKVVHQRAIPVLDEKERSKGSLIFKKPDRIVLKLDKPRNEEVHTNGKKWWVVSRDEKQVEVYDASPDGELSAESAFLDFGYGRGSAKLLERYRVKLIATSEHGKEEKDKETRYRLEFTPRRKADRTARYSTVEVEITDRTWLPREFVLHESKGEIIHTYTLSEIRINTGVKDRAFDYRPPRGYAVVVMDDL